jgi:hypothetical protein
MPIEDTQPDEAGSKPITAEDVPKSRRALSRLKRELSDDDLASPGVQKLLLDSLERIEEENAGLKSLREKYHQADKQNGVLEEKLKTSTSVEIVSMGSLAVGAAALGYAPSAWASQPTGWIALSFGVVLTAFGIAAKVVRR